MKISLFLGMWLFIISFSFQIANDLDHDFVSGYELFFLKITYPVLLFLGGCVIYKYIKNLVVPLLLITSFTCLVLVGPQYADLFYLLPIYLTMYLGGYYSAVWYAKYILLKN